MQPAIARAAPGVSIAVATVYPILESRSQPNRALLTTRKCKLSLKSFVTQSRLQSASANTVETSTISEEKQIADPWTSDQWKGIQWTVYRGKAYDITKYINSHPGGSQLLRLAIGRDCTALLESYHLRPEVAIAMLRRMPKLENFPIDMVPRSPYPNDSELYCAIRERVRSEIFQQKDNAHKTGSEGAAALVLLTAALASVVYIQSPGLISGMFLGLAGAWIGLTVQHCANHGAMSANPHVNNLLGLTDDLIGGSSLMWRYHHQVSHHIHTNHSEYDEDVFSAMPMLRFDKSLRREWYHQFQHIYMWLLFPFLQFVFQIGDLQSLFTNRTKGATMYGASVWEKATVLLGKLAHFSIILFLPLWNGAVGFHLFLGICAYMTTQSIVLASTFAVSHNVEEAKDKTLSEDWGVRQVETSANWGGVVGNFLTGGLNLQIEHHLFPAISFLHYPSISRIVAEECEKRGVQYATYSSLSDILARFIGYMKDAGREDMSPMHKNESGGSVLARF